LCEEHAYGTNLGEGDGGVLEGEGGEDDIQFLRNIGPRGKEVDDDDAIRKGRQSLKLRQGSDVHQVGRHDGGEESESLREALACNRAVRVSALLAAELSARSIPASHS